MLRRPSRRELDMLASADTKRPEPVRECGGCTECCTLVTVKALHKESYTPCRYLAPEGGCAVYQKRPFGCRLFRCAWIEGEGGNNERPDQVGFVIERSWILERHLGFGPIYRVYLAEHHNEQVLKDFVTAAKAVDAVIDMQTPEFAADGLRRCYVECPDPRRLQAFKEHEQSHGRTFLGYGVPK